MRVLAVVLALAACGSDRPADVTGSLHLRYPAAEVPVDLTGFEIDALVQNGEMWTTYPGVGAADGTFVVPGVPDGEFMLRYRSPDVDDWPVHVVTTERTLHLTEVRVGRPDEASASPGSSIQVNVESLVPWEPTDRVRLHVHEGSIFPLAGDAAPGGTSGTFGAVWDERTLVDFSYRVFVVQERSVGASSDWSVIAGGELESFEMVDGGITSVNVSLAPQALTDHVFDWRGAATTALAEQVDPADALQVLEIAIKADRAVLGARPLDAIDAPITLSYTDPFPVEWPRWVSYQWAALGTVLPYRGVMAVVVPLEEAMVTPLTWTVSPVRSPRIEGRDLLEPQGGVTTTPRIEWDPPDTGAERYEIRVYQDGVAGDFQTIQTSLELPAGLLMPEVPCSARIRAISGSELERHAVSDITTDEFTP